MLKWLFSGTERRRRREEEREFSEIILSDPKPRSFCLSSGGGRATAVNVDAEGSRFDVLLQHKLRSSDVKDGKLLPASAQVIRRRGGKVITQLGLTHRTAEELHKMLGQALVDARRKRRRVLFQERVLRTLVPFIFEHIARSKA